MISGLLWAGRAPKSTEESNKIDSRARISVEEFWAQRVRVCVRASARRCRLHDARVRSLVHSPLCINPDEFQNAHEERAWDERADALPPPPPLQPQQRATSSLARSLTRSLARLVMIPARGNRARCS